MPMPGRPFGRRGALLLAALLTLLALPSAALAATAPAPSGAYSELYRPQFHFTPAKNWMNDPNGLILYKGEYHLFFQHNPNGTVWGDMSWGHAVSRDLVHWKQLPLAIPADATNYIFSGSVVVDKANTSGLGTTKNPAMVAVYTRAARDCCRQTQALAYSTDRGRTWKQYDKNPVIDIGSGEFRDPKVFWHAPSRRWVMVVALGQERRLSFYNSPNLKDWTHLSDFGPANSADGAWECPDLFQLPVDGDRKRLRWVLLVNVQQGAIAGGSGAQYFLGDFDGTTFHADDTGPYTPPGGDLAQGFEGSDYGAWTATGDAFGSGPAQGALDGQSTVTGFVGAGLANSFHGFDAGRGTLTSPEFTIGRPYLNFLVGGGAHPHDPAAVDGPAPGGTVLADFEGGSYGDGWTATGTFAGTSPAAGTLPDQQTVSGFEGQHLVNTFVDHDNGTGRLTSPAFEITADHLNFLVGGGSHPYPGDAGNPPAAVTLIVDGQVVRSATGQESEALNWTGWDVSALKGKQARIEIVDENTGGWGHILADQFTLSDQAAAPRSTETSVNLLVDGQVVRSATGANSEALDWAGWNVKSLAGKQARIQIVDNNTGGWGHILADQFTFADQGALSPAQRSHWVDFGKDHYAVNTFEGVPGGRRVAIAWMNNWNYASSIPTSPWRSAMTVPRELELKTLDGRPRLVQRPIGELESLRAWPPFRRAGVQIPAGTTTLPVGGKAVEIRAELQVGTAKRAGIKVRTGAGEETVIGYDTETGELYVDRTRSGEASFSRDFPGVHRAPLEALEGRVKLRILVDWSSVEVFANGGRVALTDQIFPRADSAGIQLFADGGAASLKSLEVWRLRSSW
jgi:fructan beta-fructosidase